MPRTNRWKDAFGIVLFMLVASFLVIAILGDDYRGNEIVVFIQAFAVLITYRAANVQGPRFLVVSGIAVIAILGTGIAGILGGDASRLISAGSLLILLAMLPAVIFSRLRHFDRIDVRTIYAALCIYLIIGMFYSVVYQLLNALAAEQLFVQLSRPSALDTLYFSFTTLTTLGYGDMTPATDLGKTLSITEALIGQVYLVTVVALIVANLGRERGNTHAERRPSADDADAGSEDTRK